MTTTVEQHLKEYTAEFGPKSCHERFLVGLMAYSRWKLARLTAIESRLFEIVAADLATPAQAKALDSIQRYIAAAERTYYRAFREFQAGRKAIKAEADALIREMHAVANAPMPNLDDMSKPEPPAPKTETAPRKL